MSDSITALRDLRTALIEGTDDIGELIQQFDAILHQSHAAHPASLRELPASLRELANRAEAIRWTAVDADVRPRLLALLDSAVQLLSRPADVGILRPDLGEQDNNVYGTLSGDAMHRIRARFARAGWRVRDSNFYHELELEWVKLDIEDDPSGEIRVEGTVDPARFDDLVAALDDIGVGYDLEFYDESGTEIDHRRRT